MAVTKLGFYELLAPQFLVGFSFTALDFLDYLGIDKLEESYDESAVVYTGICSFGGDGGALPNATYKGPGGAVFSSEDYQLSFRLTIPRHQGSGLIQTAINAVNTVGVEMLYKT